MKYVALYFEIPFLLISVWITFYVGRSLYHQGLVLIADLFGSQIVSQQLNKLLLIGYYLVNMGFAAISVTELSNIHSLASGFQSFTFQLGALLMILAFLHFNNLMVLGLLQKNKNAVKTFFES